ncbi:MAG TPA: hypothetical protein DIT13_20145, partial [Verrucomicrobiales bacterium]|nr:hypothetical protein [Verrucomicrobiales bacterium]
MDGKILAYIFLLAAVVAATYGVYQTTLIDDAQRELNVLQAQVESTASAMQQMSRTLELRKQEQAREEEQGKKMEHLQKEQETAKTDVEKAETDLKTLIAEHGKVRAEFERDIARAREETVGMEFFEMELANGSVLKNAKIQRVEEAVLTILHSQGISKIPVNDVHGKLKDRLQIGRA